MKRSIKNILLLSLSALLLIVASFSILSIRSAKAAAIDVADNAFYMSEGAETRVVTDSNGLRFEAVIANNLYDQISNENKTNYKENTEVGMLIIPNLYIDKYNIDGNYHAALAGQDFMDLEFEHYKLHDSAKYNNAKIFKGAITNIKEENTDIEFVGIGYYKVGDEYHYASINANNPRTIADVALLAMLDDTDDVNNSDEAQAFYQEYTGAERVSQNKELTITSQNQENDLTFKIKTTNNFESAKNDINFIINDNAEQKITLKTNMESDFDGVFKVESEGGTETDNWYTITVNSELFNADDKIAFAPSDVTVVMKDVEFIPHNDHAIADIAPISLFTPKTIDDKEHSFIKEKTMDNLTSDEYIFLRSSGSDLTDVNGHTVKSKGSGDFKVLVKSRFNNAKFDVRVSYPISSAADLDFLSLVTYRENAETASKYLSANYLFTNDIDYSTHTRNYILPIASVNHEISRSYNSGWKFKEEYRNLTSGSIGEFLLGGLGRGSYYSLGWKYILGLTEATTTVSTETHRYLKNSDDSEFRGVNPNGLAFTGRMDGNGYAIGSSENKAYYMLDNLQGQPRNGGSSSSASYTGVGGFFIGYNIGIIENLEIYASVADPMNINIQITDAEKPYEHKYVSSSTSLTATYRAMSDKMLNSRSSEGQKGLPFTSYNPHRGGSIGATGLVAVNNGTIKNIYHNVLVKANCAETVLSAQGVLVGVNGNKIENCIVDKIEDTSRPGGETTIAIITLAKDATEGSGGTNSFYPVGRLKGSSITGCYSLLKRNVSTNIAGEYSLPKALSFDEGSVDAYSQITNNNLKDFFAGAGSIDNLSKTVYTNCGATAQRNWDKDYNAMYDAYDDNKNLDPSIWDIVKVSDNNVSIKLSDGLVAVN